MRPLLLIASTALALAALPAHADSWSLSTLIYPGNPGNVLSAIDDNGDAIVVYEHLLANNVIHEILSRSRPKGGT